VDTTTGSSNIISRLVLPVKSNVFVEESDGGRTRRGGSRNLLIRNRFVVVHDRVGHDRIVWDHNHFINTSGGITSLNSVKFS
jgi:hypothetical protein